MANRKLQQPTIFRKEQADHRKLRLAYITSCRELGNKGDEKIGRVIIDPETGKCLGYREGLLEHLFKISSINNKFSSMFEIALVLYDDLKSEFDTEWGNSKLWPLTMKNSEGMSVQKLSKRVPSSWRKEKHQKLKILKKAKYENKIVDLLKKNNIDLIIVDSYRCIIGPNLLSAYKARILNIHPGVLSSKLLETPGAFPTRDSITRAKYGYIIVDDKKLSGKVRGKKIFVLYKGSERKAVVVRKTAYSGVTVHVVTDKIDSGPIVLDRIYQFKPEEMTEDKLRQKNYVLKNRAMPLALIKYVNDNPSLFYGD